MHLFLNPIYQFFTSRMLFRQQHRLNCHWYRPRRLSLTQKHIRWPDYRHMLSQVVFHNSVVARQPPPIPLLESWSEIDESLQLDDHQHSSRLVLPCLKLYIYACSLICFLKFRSLTEYMQTRFSRAHELFAERIRRMLHARRFRVVLNVERHIYKYMAIDWTILSNSIQIDVGIDLQDMALSKTLSACT